MRARQGTMKGREGSMRVIKAEWAVSHRKYTCFVCCSAEAQRGTRELMGKTGTSQARSSVMSLGWSRENGCDRVPSTDQRIRKEQKRWVRIFSLSTGHYSCKLNDDECFTTEMIGLV